MRSFLSLKLLLFFFLLVISSSCSTRTISTDKISESLTSELSQFSKQEPLPAPNLKLKELEIQKWVSKYNGDQKVFVGDSMNRLSKYHDTISFIFDYFGLPQELKMLAAVESRFISNAKNSSSGAYGMWQFMPETAKELGLEVSYLRDERADVVKSTIAAARFLRRLYNEFYSWELALASYNRGQYGVLRTMKTHGTTDFYELARARNLPGETINFVYKVYALMYIYSNYSEINQFAKKID